MTTKLTFGADPEFFVYRSDDPQKRPVPACGLFGGAKKSPVFLSPDGGYLEDGAAVEFNVAPASTLTEVRKKIDTLITAFLVQHKGYSIYPSSSAQFEQKVLRSHPSAMVVGCDADFWAHGIRIKPQISNFKNWRFAGGHIHIGLDPWPQDLDTRAFIKFLDIATWCNVVAGKGDNLRFNHYGFPGLYRETPYGIEYRSPDNSWCAPESAYMAADLLFWSQTVKSWDLRIQTAVDVIDTLGATAFNSVMDHLDKYFEFKTYFNNYKSSAQYVSWSRVFESFWNRFLAYRSNSSRPEKRGFA